MSFHPQNPICYVVIFWLLKLNYCLFFWEHFVISTVLLCVHLTCPMLVGENAIHQAFWSTIQIVGHALQQSKSCTGTTVANLINPYVFPNIMHVLCIPYVTPNISLSVEKLYSVIYLLLKQGAIKPCMFTIQYTCQPSKKNLMVMDDTFTQDLHHTT